MTRPTIGIGIVGFGWMGQAHARSYRRIPMLFPERLAEPELVAVSDTLAARTSEAVASFGFRDGSVDWRAVVEHPDVDLVVVTAPNALHLELVEAAAAAGKHVFCEKPVGATPEQTLRAALAARAAGIVGAVGYEYRFAPLLRYAKRLLDEGRLGRVTHCRFRFFSMYGSDPLGLLSWRFLASEGGHGASGDLLGHAVDLAHLLVGPVARVVGARATFIAERPLPRPGIGTHYGRGRAEDPAGAVTNEDYAGLLVEFADGARGTFEASRTLVGPESQLALDVYGTEGAFAWNLERLNELRLYLAGEELHTGYTTVLGGERFPHHGAFAPGSANGIGLEDLVAIEDYELLQAIARGEPYEPGLEAALEVACVQDALVRSWSSERWEPVRALEAAA